MDEDYEEAESGIDARLIEEILAIELDLLELDANSSEAVDRIAELLEARA